LLTNATRQAATERPNAIGGTPELANAVSGKAYNFFDNVLRFKSFTLNFLRFGFVLGSCHLYGRGKRSIHRISRRRFPVGASPTRRTLQPEQLWR
jgi:hypothetical protein